MASGFTSSQDQAPIRLQADRRQLRSPEFQLRGPSPTLHLNVTKIY